jgi:hypothetical protein
LLSPQILPTHFDRVPSGLIYVVILSVGPSKMLMISMLSKTDELLRIFSLLRASESLSHEHWVWQLSEHSNILELSCLSKENLERR